MHNFLFSYDPIDTPKCNEIVRYTIPNSQEYDPSWIEAQGEVIMRIPCSDGLIIILRVGYRTAFPGDLCEN